MSLGARRWGEGSRGGERNLSRLEPSTEPQWGSISQS